MSTNFYFICKDEDFEDISVNGHRSDDPEWHIGKRYAAGLYCWDCNIKMPNSGVKGPLGPIQVKTCPKCGKEYKNEGWNSAEGRELGFNKLGKKTGVATASGFNWAMTFENFCKKIGEDVSAKIIINEYREKFNIDEFINILNECPIQKFDSIGSWFS